MSDSPQDTRSSPAPPASGRASLWLRRLTVTLLLALSVGWISATAMRWDASLPGPAGFGRGLLHGALMPLAWPTLITGRDQTIYADRNSGRTYKLGYSLGVNACGLVFFGWFFARLHRWRASSPATASTGTTHPLTPPTDPS